MTQTKTRYGSESVNSFLKKIEDEKMRKECQKILAIMQSVTDEHPKIWGQNIIGFGSYHYVYDSRQEGDWFMTGFSPHKQDISLYFMGELEGFEELLEKLGKYKKAQSCLKIKSLDDIDLSVLKSLIKQSVDHLRVKYRQHKQPAAME
jgi:hypothetical protein